MSSSPLPTRPAHGRRRAARRRPPAWVGRTALAAAGLVALASGTATGALVDAVADGPGPLASAPVAGPADDDVASRGPVDAVATLERAAPSSAGTDAQGEAWPPPEAVPADAVEVPLPVGMTVEDAAAGLLSLEMPTAAQDELVVVPGKEQAPLPERDVRTVRVEVERGLDIDGGLFARQVMDTLNDPRSWGADGSVSFARTDGEADLRVVLASPDKVDEMCAPLTTRGIYSCGAYGHAALNHMRWVQGTEEFDDLTQYRQYLVNHEVGHLLGRRHEDCPGAGQVAPVMQQQTIRVAPCLPNAWPYPDAS